MDEFDPIPPSVRPKPHGGVATLWRKELDSYIGKHKDGNERVLPVTLSTKNCSICIINCYLPSGHSSEAMQKTREDLAMLEEIIIKFKNGHFIIITGDLNLDIYNKNTAKEKLFRSLCNKHNIKIQNNSISHLYTYEHPSKITDKSHLDYIAVDSRLSADNITVLKKDTSLGSLNSSSHTPVCINVRHGSLKKAPTLSIVPGPSPRLKWDEGNIQLYQDTVEEELKSYPTQHLDADGKLEMAASILNTAALTAIPSTSTKVPKGPKKPWSPQLAQAEKESKEAHYKWKMAGRPEKSHPLTIARREASRNVRSVQRVMEKDDRSHRLTRIMAASETDQATFHMLIRRQRSTPNSSDAILIDGILTFDAAEQRAGWRGHFAGLATESISDTESETLLNKVRNICSSRGRRVVISEDMIRVAVARLNKKKAADMEGITAEHIIHAPQAFIEYLVVLVQEIFDQASVPSKAKSGYKLAIAKKGKDPKERNNYRGITITALVGKIVEHVVLLLEAEQIEEANSDMQYGFTESRSPSMATLCVTEATAYARDNDLNMIVATLDAQKAFDMVNQVKLKLKLFRRNIQGKVWCVIDDMYSGCQERVKWKGMFSETYEVTRGVRQGGVLSTGLYKVYLDGLLEMLERLDMGCKIGTVNLCDPTCADDLALLSFYPSEMQCMLNVSKSYSEDHYYDIHPIKSTVTLAVSSKKDPVLPECTWSLGDAEMPITDSFSHLGITWVDGNPDVSERIQLARRTVYSLMGAGLHGENGSSPAASVKLINTYVLPRLIHGLEATVLPQKDLKAMSNYYKNLLRQVQGLPPRVATEAIYLLTGTLPLEAVLHERVLNLLGSVYRLKEGHRLRELGDRQMMNGPRSHSWFVYARKVATSYGIEIDSLGGVTWRKSSWKSYVKASIKQTSWASLIKGATNKSSLQWLDMSPLKLGQCHPIWTSCMSSPYQVKRAMVRAKLLTGCYSLQENYATWYDSESPTCQLCNSETETVVHLLLRCPETSEIRSSIIDDFIENTEDLRPRCVTAEQMWVRGLLNGGFGVSFEAKKDQVCIINNIANNLCFRIDRYRFNKLKNVDGRCKDNKSTRGTVDCTSETVECTTAT